MITKLKENFYNWGNFKTKHVKVFLSYNAQGEEGKQKKKKKFMYMN